MSAEPVKNLVPPFQGSLVGGPVDPGFRFAPPWVTICRPFGATPTLAGEATAQGSDNAGSSAGFPGSTAGLEGAPQAVFSANAEIQERAHANLRMPLDSRVRGKDEWAVCFRMRRLWRARADVFPQGEPTTSAKDLNSACSEAEPWGGAIRREKTPKAVFSANAEIQERVRANLRTPLDSRVRGKDAARRVRTAGFTLIEIMVAMTILVVLVGGVYVCFASVADTAYIARTATEDLRVKQFLWNHLRDHLDSVSPKVGGEYALVGEDDSGPYGDADTLRFTTTLAAAGARSLPGITKTVEYYVDDPTFEDDSGFRTFDEGLEEEAYESVTLFITENPLKLVAGGGGDFFQDEDAVEDEEGLWERQIPIRSINFQYYDGAAEDWVDEWDSSQLGVLPWAIKVQLNLAKSEEQLNADAAAGVDPRENFDLEITAVLPAGAGTLGEFVDPNHYRSVEEEAAEVGEE